jgi:hypothetical protein
MAGPGGLPLLFGLLIGALGIAWWTNLVTFAFGETVRVDGVVVSTEESLPLLPESVYVRYEVRGRDYEVDVAAAGSLEEGEAVRILVDQEDPGRARLADGDRTVQGALVTGIAAVVLFAIGGRNVRRAWGGLRDVEAASKQEGAEARYVLFVGPDGKPWAMVFPPTGPARPELAVPLLEDVRGCVPVAGRAEARGRMAGGEPLVLVVGGVVLLPGSTALDVAADEAARLLNGEMAE